MCSFRSLIFNFTSSCWGQMKYIFTQILQTYWYKNKSQPRTVTTVTKINKEKDFKWNTVHIEGLYWKLMSVLLILSSSCQGTKTSRRSKKRAYPLQSAYCYKYGDMLTFSQQEWRLSEWVKKWQKTQSGTQDYIWDYSPLISSVSQEYSKSSSTIKHGSIHLYYQRDQPGQFRTVLESPEQSWTLQERPRESRNVLESAERSWGVRDRLEESGAVLESPGPSWRVRSSANNGPCIAQTSELSVEVPNRSAYVSQRRRKERVLRCFAVRGEQPERTPTVHACSDGATFLRSPLRSISAAETTTIPGHRAGLTSLWGSAAACSLFYLC